MSQKYESNLAQNIFGLIIILDFLYPFFKLKDPQIILLSFSFLLCGGQTYFKFLYLVSWVAPLAVGHIFNHLILTKTQKLGRIDRG